MKFIVISTKNGKNIYLMVILNYFTNISYKLLLEKLFLGIPYNEVLYQ